jgi:hypothetical protein
MKRARCYLSFTSLNYLRTVTDVSGLKCSWNTALKIKLPSFKGAATANLKYYASEKLVEDVRGAML